MPSKPMPLSMIHAVLLLSGLVGAFRVIKKTDEDEVSADESNISGPDIEIVNGRDAKECAFPWQVELHDRYGQFCGGTLIRADWVLTAAHCVNGDSPSNLNVTAGQYNLNRKSGNEQTSPVRRIHAHPKYNRRRKVNDIALLELNRPMKTTKCVGLAQLPSRDVSPGTTCKITGWGTTREGNDWGADILQEGDVKVISNRDCERTGYEDGKITADMLCAQGSRNGRVVDACQGDSGGPLTCGSTVYGATSWGKGCARKDYPGVWAKVYYFRDWIDSTMRR